MNLLHVTITARSPLVFPERKPGVQFASSLRYIPGAAIYGALGTLLGDPEVNRFNPKLFRSIRCHNAYPAWPAYGGCREDCWSRPLPLTAEKPKGADDILLADTLVDRVCWEYLQPPGIIFSPTDQDGRAWEGERGFHAPALPDEQNLHRQIKRTISQRVLTRVTINRQRGTADDSRLYSPLALNEVNSRRRYIWEQQASGPDHEKAIAEEFHSYFIGSVVVPTGFDLAADLEAIRCLGGRTTTGTGQVQVQVQPRQTETADRIKERVRQLTDLFHARASVYKRLSQTGAMPTSDAVESWPPQEGVIFTIDLLAHAILYEQGWRPTMVLTAQMLREAAKLEAEVMLLRSFANYGYAGGWNVCWPGPKPSVVSTMMGSAFVFVAPRGLTETDYQRLADLQLIGIGDRRAEGFGQIRVCDEFHLTSAFHLPSGERGQTMSLSAGGDEE